MRAVTFHRSVKSDRQTPTAAVASVIVQSASDHHHLVNHALAPVAEFIPQDSQPLHRGKGVLDRDATACQQPVELSMTPVQLAPPMAFIWSYHSSGPTIQSCKPAVSQHIYCGRQTQPRLIRHPFARLSGRYERRTPQNFSLPHNNNILHRMALLAPPV